MKMTKSFLPCNRLRRPLRSPTHTVPVPACPEHLSLGGEPTLPPEAQMHVGDKRPLRWEGVPARPSPDGTWQRGASQLKVSRADSPATRRQHCFFLLPLSRGASSFTVGQEERR